MLAKQARYKEAKPLLQQAVEQEEGKHIEIYEHLGDVYFQLQDVVKAEGSWREALKVAEESIPPDKRAAEIRKKLDALRKLGTNATATQFRDYLASLRGWTGVMGTYDFRQTPQRGISQDAIIIDRWDTATSQFTPVGRPGGYL